MEPGLEEDTVASPFFLYQLHVMGKFTNFIAQMYGAIKQVLSSLFVGED